MKGDLGSWNLSGQKSLNGFLTFKEAQALILQQCQTTLGPQSSLGHYLCVYTWDELVITWILSLKKKFDLQNAFVVTEKKCSLLFEITATQEHLGTVLQRADELGVFLS